MTLLRVIPTMSFCLTIILTFYLAYIPTFSLSLYLANILTFYLAYIWFSIWYIFGHSISNIFLQPILLSI